MCEYNMMIINTIPIYFAENGSKICTKLLGIIVIKDHSLLTKSLACNSFAFHL